MYRGVFSGLLILLPVALQATDYYCIERSSPMPRMSGHCQGLQIPATATRNFIAEKLLCSRGSHSHTRLPVIFNEEKWRDLHNTDPKQAQQMVRNQPTPEWSATVNYSTHLHWSWEECQLITDADRCGTETVCETYRNEEGKEREKCHEEAKSCYADVIIHDTLPCSNEQLDYDVRFLAIENNVNYPPRLANGYDLLPGEKEGIEVNNGIGYAHSAYMAPQMAFREPRNRYQIDRMAGDLYDTYNLPCQQNRHYRIGFTVIPIERIRSRSGNAFSLPKSFDGQPVEPLVWQSVRNSKGQRQQQGYPAVLRVQDYSSTALNEFALDTDNPFKRIRVRIQLYDQSIFSLPFPRSTIYIDEEQAVQQTLNALSDEQHVRRSSLWEIMLETDKLSPRKNLYRAFIPWFIYYPARLLLPANELSYENHLHPGTNYQLSLTVYQGGLPIYHQSCEDEPDAWGCQFYLGGGWLSPWRYESQYYSDTSLDISFTSPKEINLRSWWAFFWNSVGYLDELVLVGTIIISVHYCTHQKNTI